ncbi:DNA-methyltransferase [Natrinema versiforme]|uniref:Type II methyltransferase n=1 Tax=Natrinema versiforme JCM 10478 TaxID=1227496 RepID=L9Y568_9EURY|nr:site-specific DNA-methyltransferase [Natrinema versiforme]ELY68872.1 DNA methylase N-4/N-6 domain-containing protein [Natrinema versiforme JCM 10478]
MNSDIDAYTNDIHEGDAAETLAKMPDSSIHCAVTSPPYWQLRDYEIDGQLGQEPTLEDYVASIVEIGEQVRRVLRDDGSWWLNLGDGYGDDKQKQLVPQRVAIALQDAGWLLRNDIVWEKTGGGVPEPVTDRATKGHEMVYHLVPADGYWYDTYGVNPDGTPVADVWDIFPTPYDEAHFATFPKALPERMVKLSCPPTVCAACQTPYRRATEEIQPWTLSPDDVERPQLKRALERYHRSDLTPEHLEACRALGFADAGHGKNCQTGTGNNTARVEDLAAEAKAVLDGYFREFATTKTEPDGFEQSCDCETDATEPGIVLDPFAGAGTTCLVAKRLGRRFIGTELNPEYVALAQKRIGVTVDEPDRLLEDDETSLSAFTDGGTDR